MGDKNSPTANVNRTVKTLLLTKINHDNYSFDSYRGMYDKMRCKRSGNTFTQGKRFLSLGSVDAFSLYDTTSEEILNKNNWFGELYNDRKEIIRDSSESICYHPIHLIANSSGVSENGSSSTPFCLVTLIYGITEDTDQLEKKLSRDTCELLSDNEWKIKAFLEGINSRPSGTVEVYNAVNLCDAVIIWHTDDIIGTLKCADLISGSNFARKTFTLVGIQWSAEHHFITKEARTALQKHSEPDAYSLKIQGSIRDRSSFDALVQSIVCAKEFEGQKTEPIDDYVSYLVPGQADFTILINSLSGIQLEGLLRFYLFGTTEPSQGKPSAEDNNIDLVSPACWDIHTDVLFNYKKPSNNQMTGSVAPEVVTPNKGAQDINSLGSQDQVTKESGNHTLEETKPLQFNIPFSINHPAETVISLYKKYCNNIFDKMDNAPWVVAFFELLTVHASIDRHPVLSGTSFLIRRFLEVTYYYLDRYKNAKEEENRKKAETVLSQSQDTLQEVIRVWGVLTEQMLRIDDFVFRGIGNSSVLFNTLPECALDFYHAFLHQFVDVLLEMDKDCDRLKKEDAYHYDFLLLPELDRKISILPVFNADATWRPIMDESVRQLGPPQQVFIVYFPIETVFSPIGFFAPLLHECFHYFGDAFRLRAERTTYYCRFLSDLIVANISGSWHKVSNNSTLNIEPINQIIYNHLFSLFEPDIDRNYHVEAEPTEQETYSYLKLDNVKEVLCKQEVARELCDRLSVQITCEFGFDILSLEGLRLRKSIYDILYSEYENTSKAQTQYLDIGIWLESGIQKLFVEDDHDGLKLIQYSAKVNYEKLSKAYGETISRRKIHKKAKTPDVYTNWESTLSRSWYYFKECYADLMMIQILDLEPDTYLTLFWDEMQDEKDWISTAERISFVLAVAYKEKDQQLNKKVAEAFRAAEQRIGQCDEKKKAKQQKVTAVISSIATCLLQQNTVPELGKDVKALPTATWRDIYEYLCAVKSKYSAVKAQKSEIDKKVIEMQKQFSTVFKNGGFLRKDFFDVINEYHSKTISSLNRSSNLQQSIEAIIPQSKNAFVTAALNQLSLQLRTADVEMDSAESIDADSIELALVEVERCVKEGKDDCAIRKCKEAYDLLNKTSQ